MLPHNLVKTSTADMVFWGYYDSTSMKCESILELTKTDETKGTFRFTEMNGISSGTALKAGQEIKIPKLELKKKKKK